MRVNNIIIVVTLISRPLASHNSHQSLLSNCTLAPHLVVVLLLIINPPELYGGLGDDVPDAKGLQVGLHNVRGYTRGLHACIRPGVITCTTYVALLVGRGKLMLYAAAAAATFPPKSELSSSSSYISGVIVRT